MMDPRVEAHGKAMLLVLLLGLPALLGLLPPGTVSGHDIQYHTVALSQFHEALRAGDWLPRWAPDMAGGYGYPNFVFYPPLAYYLAMVPVWLGATYAQAWDWVIGVFLVASGLSTYLLAARWGRVAGVVAGVAYVYAPYHLVVAYVKGNPTELVAMAWFPLAVLAFDRLLQSGKPRHAVAFALVLAITVATHSVSGLLLAGTVLLYWIVVATCRRDLSSAWPAGAAFGMGLALSAFAWWPALAEQAFVQADVMGSGYFHYSRHFVPLADLFVSVWNYGVSGYPAQFSRQFGLLQWLGLLGALVLWRRPGGRVARTALVVLALACVFLCLEASGFVWRVMPVLPDIQFPWRMLAPAVLAGSVLFGWLVAQAPAAWRSAPAAIALAMVLLLDAGHARPWVQMHREPAFGTPSHVRQITFDAIGSDITHIYHAYLPRGASLPASVREAPARGDGMRVEGRAGALQVDADHAGTLVINVFAYPGWRVWVDGERVDPVAEPSHGLLSVPLAPGRHEVIYRFGASPARLGAGMVSWSAAAGLLAWMAWLAWRRRSPRTNATA